MRAYEKDRPEQGFSRVFNLAAYGAILPWSYLFGLVGIIVIGVPLHFALLRFGVEGPFAYIVLGVFIGPPATLIPVDAMASAAIGDLVPIAFSFLLGA